MAELIISRRKSASELFSRSTRRLIISSVIAESSNQGWRLQPDPIERIDDDHREAARPLRRYLGARVRAASLCRATPRGGARPSRQQQAAERPAALQASPPERPSSPPAAVGATPTPQTLEPEATGAATEVTNWLKPSEKARAKMGHAYPLPISASQITGLAGRRDSLEPLRGLASGQGWPMGACRLFLRCGGLGDRLNLAAVDKGDRRIEDHGLARLHSSVHFHLRA
jgi:hypothetical protein